MEREKTCFHLHELPPYLKKTYRRMALVTHRRHVERLDTQDEDTLFVSSNWLLWQECLHQNRHCVHLDFGILGWDDGVDIANNYPARAGDWIYLDGRDVTCFQGVSLGCKLITPVAMIYCDYQRSTRALETLVDRFKPREIIFFDLRPDDVSLDMFGRFAIVLELTEKFGITLTDRRDPLRGDDPNVPTSYGHAPAEQTRKTWKSRTVVILGRTFEILASVVSRLGRALNAKRPAVLMVNSFQTSIPLLHSYDGTGIVPMCYAKWFPRKKDIGFLVRSLFKGVLLVDGPRPRLTAKDRLAVAEIERRLESAWQEAAQGTKAAIRRYVRDQIIATKRFYELARQVRWAEGVLDRYRPKVVFIDGFQNPICNIFLELAKQRGIRTAATWHSIWVYDVKLETLGGNPRVEPLVERCFTWGKANEDWLDAIGARTAKVRTGSLAASQHYNTAPTDRNHHRALILQYVSPTSELVAPHALEYNYFVEIVRMLWDLGYSKIRVKCHPGAPKDIYYKQIAEYFSLECEVFSEGPVKKFVDWADFVIGPVFTGAMLEVLAAGKPYYPVNLPPNSVNINYFDGSRLFTDLDSLRHALENGETPDSRKILNDFTSYDDIRDPAKRVWEALQDGVA